MFNTRDISALAIPTKLLVLVIGVSTSVQAEDTVFSNMK